MTQQEKELFYFNIKDMCEYLETRCNDLVDQQHEVMDRDFYKALEYMKSPDDEGDYLTTILDAQMDTMVKTMLNIIVMVQTEKILTTLNVNPTLPDPVEYALANKEKYGIEEETESLTTR